MNTAPDAHAAWPGFLAWFAGGATVVAAGLFAFVVAMDPYGQFVTRARAPGPIMDLNQRYMYPQIVRSGRYDSALFGTSSIRLVDPAALGRSLDASAANLGMNAATPWEQVQLATLFLSNVAEPKFLIFGLDNTWCAADADQKRLTFRSFPPWLYDDRTVWDLFEQFNLTTLQIAGRVAAQKLGLLDERIRGDGYEVFTPPEHSYDLARARIHLWAGDPVITPIDPPYVPSAQEQASWRFPALDWLAELLARVPQRTRVVLVFPPSYVTAQPRPGSVDEARENVCKAKVKALAEKRNMPVADYRWPSPVNTAETNFWDPLHYRLPVAERLMHDLSSIASGTSPKDNGFLRMLTQTSQPGH